MSITVATQSKAWTVFCGSNTGIVGSNPTQGMDVCVRLFCVGSDLASGWTPPKESYRLCKKIKKLKKQGRAIAQAVSRWIPTAAPRV
jgi:hypothetical protein